MRQGQAVTDMVALLQRKEGVGANNNTGRMNPLRFLQPSDNIALAASSCRNAAN
ncbi:hypothetical protein P775_05460 [Puniceibacterium antarcticum]|uniref:Uncharacterized protein n=1 Tax=Puniceibacterium antarcticum TaxID=1206336 RepID=A0A2G8RI50_9RHOB|nr:hypothetical protein P775_05460 [Puniceibacterium antarcticum]